MELRNTSFYTCISRTTHSYKLFCTFHNFPLNCFCFALRNYILHPFRLLPLHRAPLLDSIVPHYIHPSRCSGIDTYSISTSPSTYRLIVQSLDSTFNCSFRLTGTCRYITGQAKVKDWQLIYVTLPRFRILDGRRETPQGVGVTAAIQHLNIHHTVPYWRW